MGLQKGRTNNPGGRPKGAGNKDRKQLRELVSGFLDNNFHRIEKLIKGLEPREQVKFYIDLLPYALPRLQSVSLDTTFERLENDQLDEIIKRLLDGNTIYQERENSLSNGRSNGHEKYN